MRIRKVIIAGVIAVLMGFAFDAVGQSAFYGGIVHELSGPVKKFKIKTENPLVLKKKADFLKDGRQKLSTWVYDDNGYPFAMGFLTSADNWYNYLVEYDNEHRISNIKYRYSDKNSDRTLLWEYVYDGSRLAKTMIKDISTDTSRDVMLYEYSAEEYDPHNNWIKRSVVLTKNPNTYKAESETYTETREIEYF